MLAQNVFARIVSLASQLILAALLSPADFGLIGLAYTVSTIAAALADVGMDGVLIQRGSALRLWTGPAFWISFGLAGIAGAIVVIVSPIAATVFHAPELVGLLSILAISMPIGALSSVPGMIVRARMQFGSIAVYGTFETIVQALMTVGFARAGYGAYSFVIPTPILSIVKAVYWWRRAGCGASLRPQQRRWKHVFSRTATVLVTRWIVALIGQGDYLVLGLIANQEIVGTYYFGFRLAAQPLWMLAGNLSGVLFPALVRLKSDPVRQGGAALNASILLLFCVMPLALLQTAVAAPIVTSLFGEKWKASIPIIQLLGIGLAFDAVSWVAGALLSARGEFKATMHYALIQAPIFFALVVIGALLKGAEGVAWAVCVFYGTTQPFFVYLAFRRVGIGAREVASIYLKPTALAGMATSGGWVISQLPAFSTYPMARVGIIATAASSLYVVLVRWLAPTVWADLRVRVFAAIWRPFVN